jgi:hypothetical protein
MDQENIQLQVIPKKTGVRKRSLFCLVILVSAVTYFLIPALLFIASLVYSGKIIQFISEYYKPGDLSPENYIWISVIGSFLYLSSVAGILLFIFKRKIGFYIFLLTAVLIFSLDLAFLDFDWIRYLIHTGFIFILGIAHFSKRCYY